MNALVEAHNLVKIYKAADLEVVALQGLDLHVPRGEMLALVGPSGAGKSTLLNILGGLDTPSAGKCEVAGVDLTRLTPRERLLYRRRIVGHVWQQTSRNLLSDLSLIDNVLVPMALAGYPSRRRRPHARELLTLVGLGDRLDHKPERLSGGEQQRGALAVALANDPPLLLADEPTGELDSVTAHDVLNLLRQLNHDLGLTTVVVTHDPAVAEAMDRSVAIRDGRTSTEVVHAEEKEETVIIDGVGRLQIPRALLEALPFGGRARVHLAEDHIELWPAGAEATLNGNSGNGAAATGKRPQ
ncbi:MAG TPA: ABC transporter ATP-binding protein [Ktedonobacterales bacterium]|jgi:ABC-type lipoprotein export system ATPase subunit|nr:ABC transporter ATP-binding protein [Ktedonobacterales bacterium]